MKKNDFFHWMYSFNWFNWLFLKQRRLKDLKISLFPANNFRLDSSSPMSINSYLCLLMNLFYWPYSLNKLIRSLTQPIELIKPIKLMKQATGLFP